MLGYVCFHVWVPVLSFVVGLLLCWLLLRNLLFALLISLCAVVFSCMSQERKSVVVLLRNLSFGLSIRLFSVAFSLLSRP